LQRKGEIIIIPVNEPLMAGNELKYTSECIRTNWVSSAGKYLERFESEWAEYCGQEYGVGVSNGTVALELAVEVCNFPKRSEIILPSFTIISCAQAIVKNGCVPVLVDCDPENYCMDVAQIESRITKRTVAVMPVHIYGHPCNMDPILHISKKYGIMIIEDAAEAHGGEYFSKISKSWRRCGSFGHLACFSFYANKIVTAGEGGMVLTSDEKLLQRLRSHRNLCFLDEPRFLHHEIGNNFRMTNIQAAIGLAQLEYINKTIKRKVDMARKYSKALKKLSLQLPVEREWAKNVIWMYSVLLKEDKSTKAFFEKDWLNLTPASYAEWPAYSIMKRIGQRGIQTRPFFIGIHEQPVFRKQGFFKNEPYPVTERIARTGFYLPSGQAITDLQIKKVCDTLKGLFL
jgi:perosamine synthetase